MSDIELDRDYQKGDKEQKVKLIQEWLCLHGFHVVIDGDFGPATEHGVKVFQKKKRLKANGIVDQKTFRKLILPMLNALKPISGYKKLGKLVVAYAKQHLKQTPLEIGGQNKGPWVRLYMDGHEGAEWPWCAGFASYMLRQAAKTLNVSLPIESSFSCDELAAQAEQRKIFLPEAKADNKKIITPGSLFLVRASAKDWVHTGIVLKAGEQVLLTIEGNTNDDGSREGYEVCRRIRGYEAKDFIII
ncbi:MAG: protein with peptidoglycan-binding domain protein [Nitrospirae bacterium GWC2_56_14]|nr:MAG: protein with peptidoglycan-binding domain protein [Nitrospirae bacterium GWC2_56_14]